MSGLQMTLVCVAGLESLRTIAALERGLTGVPSEMLLVVRRMSELTAARGAREPRCVVVDK